MISQDDILSLLHGVVHPESGSDIVSLGMVGNIQVSPEKITLTLSFARARDPFAAALRKKCEQALSAAFPAYAGHVTVFIKEAPAAGKPSPGDKPAEGEPSNLSGVKTILAVSSTKGGVGKSTLTANLALTLARMNYRVGILDADLYGPSQPTIFGLEGFRPEGVVVEGQTRLLPAEVAGIKLMSIGFFIDPGVPLIWRGPMATTALRQMIHQSQWGELDFLLIDMPPGTGDVHLALISEMKITAAVIVTTPQKLALADVERGIRMFQKEEVGIPLLGVVENMAWFTPAELPDKRYYLFGQGGGHELARREGVKLLGEIPLIQGVREAADRGLPASGGELPAAAYYEDLAGNLIHQLDKLFGK